MCMKIFRIFKEFLDTKTYKNFTIFNKNSKQLTRKYHTLFNQELTYGNITKNIKKMIKNTQEFFLGIFKGFLDSKIYKNSQILTKIVNKLTRDSTYIFLRF